MSRREVKCYFKLGMILSSYDLDLLYKTNAKRKEEKQVRYEKFAP